MAEQFLPIGRVVDAHGIRGEVKLRLYNEQSELPAELEELLLRDAAGVERTYEVLHARPQNALWLMQLAGVDDRTAAEALKGRELLVRADLLPPTEEGEYYYHQLIGLQVYDVQSALIGEVIGLFNSGASEILVIQAGERELLVPFVDEIVVTVEPESGRLVIDPPDGLLDQ